MTGHVQGRTVEALVDVIGVEQVLPVIKQIPQGADLTTVDKAVQLVFTDGTTAHYEVDQWTLEAGQEDQLSTPGARLKATGLPRQWGNGPSDTSGCRRRCRQG